MGRFLVVGAVVLVSVVAGVVSVGAQTWVPPRPYDFSIAPIVSINSAENDYAPTLAPDSGLLWYASYSREDGFGNTDIYRSSARGDNRWDAGRQAGGLWNSGENEGAIAFFDGGRRAVVAMDERDGFGDTDLWLVTIEQGVPSEVLNMGAAINTDWWETQPTISSGGDTIFFASNRPGGRGGFDIWVTTLADGIWSAAAPLDSTINTSANENAPFLLANGSSLYFSSDRKGGFGREDIWMAIRKGRGWHDPVNLGPGVNTFSRELFFHAPPDYDWFFIASNRRGSVGGLDIFSGTPNIFGKGFFPLAFTITDTVLGHPAASYVTVTDVALDRIVWEFPTDTYADEPYQAWLPAERDYRITVRQTAKAPVIRPIQPTPANQAVRVDLYVGDPPPVVDDGEGQDTEIILFDLGEYNVPFFVTGYWRPNVPGALEELFDLLSGPLSSATYIERFPRRSARYREYQEYSRTVDSIFSEMADKIVTDIAPAFLKLADPDEKMGIIVTGFVDPQVFSGLYGEAIDVTFTDTLGRSHTVVQGDRIENFELSGLRAVYAREIVDRMLRKRSTEENGAFLTLLESGRITYETVAGGVSGGDTEYDRQRRIHVLIVRR